MQVNSLKDSINNNFLLWHNLTNSKDTIICDIDETGGFVFDNSGTKLSFYSTQNIGNRAITKLRYYQSGMVSSKVLVSSPIPDYKSMGIATEEPFFSTKGDKLFFYLKDENRKSQEIHSTDRPTVNVFTPMDDSLQFESTGENHYLSVINLEDNKVNLIRLQQANDFGYVLSKCDDGDYVLMSSKNNIRVSLMDNRWRRSAAVQDTYLISTNNGARKLLKKQLINSPNFSTGGKYIISFDPEEKNWFAYNVNKSTLKCISRTVPSKMYFDAFVDGNLSGLPDPFGIAGWMENDESVLIYDRRDILEEVDPDGKELPINITGRYRKYLK